MKKNIKEAIKEHLYANEFAADPNNPGFVDRFIEHTKAAEWGANWRINSVWHDAKECPERKRNYLAQCKNGRFNVIPDSMNWDNFILYQGSSDAQSTERLFQVSHPTKLAEMQGT